MTLHVSFQVERLCDTLFNYTDGVPELKNAAGEMIGEERMIEALNQDPNATPENLVANVHSAMYALVKDSPSSTTSPCSP